MLRDGFAIADTLVLLAALCQCCSAAFVLDAGDVQHDRRMSRLGGQAAALASYAKQAKDETMLKCVRRIQDRAAIHRTKVA